MKQVLSVKGLIKYLGLGGGIQMTFAGKINSQSTVVTEKFRSRLKLQVFQRFIILLFRVLVTFNNAGTSIQRSVVSRTKNAVILYLMAK